MKKLLFPLMSIAAMGLASCGGGNASSSQSSSASSSASTSSSSSESISSSSSESDPTFFDHGEYYGSISQRVAFDSANENNIDETLKDGTISDSYWNTLSGVWQNDSSSYPHNGVQSRNLKYIKDGDKTYLGFKGRGIYSTESDTKVSNGYTNPEGACIISKNRLGPGRFEINMAAMPREGGVTAMWTYSTETGSEATSQNEIDIEIGGNTSETYMREWCTSWTKHANKETKNVDVSQVAYLNDGKIHKYTFDWYTNYKNTGEKKVDWFIDGIYVATVNGGVVPEVDMPLWIGLWLPNWTSVASFDTDYMIVESISYKAFDASQYYDNGRSKSGYTQVAPSSSSIEQISMADVKSLNKISNGDFSTLEECKQDSSYHGWILDSASEGSISLDPNGHNGTSSLKLKAGTNSGEYLTQMISNSYEGYKYKYSFYAKKDASSSDSALEFHYSTIKGTAIKNTGTINIDSTDWKLYEGEITMPTSCGNLRVDLVANSGAVEFDDISLIRAD